jgi:hypothetical protein
MTYAMVTLMNPNIPPGRYIVPMAETLRPFVNQMSINGYKLCPTDLNEIVQQILIWIDAYALSGFATKPHSFVVDVHRLIANVRPVIIAEGRVLLYDVGQEDQFTQACTYLAQDFFNHFFRLYLIMPGTRSNFMLERVMPNYNLVMMTASELVYDNVYETLNLKDSRATKNRLTLQF